MSCMYVLCVYANVSYPHILHVSFLQHLNIELWNCRILCPGTSQAHENVAIEVRWSDEPPLATELS